MGRQKHEMHGLYLEIHPTFSDKSTHPLAPDERFLPQIPQDSFCKEESLIKALAVDVNVPVRSPPELW